MMKKLKPFMYIYKCDDYSGNLLILNTYNGVFLKIPKAIKEKYKRILEHKLVDYDENDSVINNLYNNQFLVDEDYNEIDTVLEAYKKTCCNQDLLFLTIMPTEKCNFRCIYCYEDFKKGKMTIEDQDKLIKFVEKRLENCKAFYVSWFGGEPLLAMDIIEYLSGRFIQMCKSKKIPYIASMTTNGYLLDLETFKKLFNLRVVKYQITLDGDKKTHDMQRVLINGGKTFDVILNNLINIKENVKTNMYKISLRTNITKNVRDNSFSDYLNLLKDLFGNDKRFGMIIRKAWNGKNEESFDKNRITNNDDIYFDEHIELLSNDEKQLFFNSEFSLSCYGGQVCYAGKQNAFVIGSDLNIYKCTVHFDNPVNNIGKINNYGMAEIDESKAKFWSGSRLYDPNTKCFTCKSALNCLGVSCAYFTNLYKEPNFYEFCEKQLNVANSSLILNSNNKKIVKEIHNESRK